MSWPSFKLNHHCRTVIPDLPPLHIFPQLLYRCLRFLPQRFPDLIHRHSRCDPVGADQKSVSLPDPARAAGGHLSAGGAFFAKIRCQRVHICEGGRLAVSYFFGCQVVGNSQKLKVSFSVKVHGAVSDSCDVIPVVFPQDQRERSFSSLLAYQRAKGKIIILSAFTSSSEDESLAKDWAWRDYLKEQYNFEFSVVFYITNNWKEGWISNGINIQEVAPFKNEKEILFQPFTFCYVKDVKFDLKKYTADIYLETVGKTEILENEIKNGKRIEYNEDLKIIQVKQ